MLWKIYGAVVSVSILETIQDGGLPHPSCPCQNCAAVKSFETKRFVVSIAINSEDFTILIDATPDFVHQAHVLKTINPKLEMGFDGILLTHLHIGHYLGLVHLGTSDSYPTLYAVMSETSHAILGMSIQASVYAIRSLWRGGYISAGFRTSINIGGAVFLHGYLPIPFP